MIRSLMFVVSILEMRSKEIIVLGAGGHAKVCIDILRTMGHTIHCCIGRVRVGDCLGLPVLEDENICSSLFYSGYHLAFIAIGDNRIRAEVASKLEGIGFAIVKAISPHASVSEGADIGKGVAVMPGAVINSGSIIDDFAIVNTCASVDHDCKVGKFSHIAPGSRLTGNVNVGNYAFIGSGSVVIPGIVIGQGAIIGAGSVVLRNIESEAIVAGVPSKSIRNK